MPKGFYEIHKITRPLREEIGEYLEISLNILNNDYDFLSQILEYLEDTDCHINVASLIADKRLLDYTRKVIQLTEEKIAFESKKTVDNAGKVA